MYCTNRVIVELATMSFKNECLLIGQLSSSKFRLVIRVFNDFAIFPVRNSEFASDDGQLSISKYRD